jgi:GT2 family glycosyltransferase
MSSTHCKIAVLITCHNRKISTIKCLESLFNQKGLGKDFEIQVYLTDDGSTDGTYDEVNRVFPSVNLIKGNGNLFWTGGMQAAWNLANQDGKEYNFILMLNDDTILFEDCIINLLANFLAIKNGAAIIIGATKDPKDQRPTYGGSSLINRYNLKTIRIIPNNISPQKCDLGNGNVMLISRAVYTRIGFLTNKFTHGIADYEYTLKARKAGITSYVASNYAGYCSNDHPRPWKNSKEATLKERIKFLYSVKGLAYREYLSFIKSYFPFYLPEVWVKLWLKTFFPILWEKGKRTSN